MVVLSLLDSIWVISLRKKLRGSPASSMSDESSVFKVATTMIVAYPKFFRGDRLDDDPALLDNACRSDPNALCFRSFYLRDLEHGVAQQRFELWLL